MTRRNLSVLCLGMAGLLPAMGWAYACQRPEPEHYPDNSAYVHALVDYKRCQAEQDHALPAAVALPEALTASPLPLAAASEAVTPDSAPDTREEAPPPFVVDGPENLDDAVAKARNIPHPEYREDKRYNRSTAQSFPLPRLDPDHMADSRVAGALEASAAGPGEQQLKQNSQDNGDKKNEDKTLAFRSKADDDSLDPDKNRTIETSPPSSSQCPAQACNGAALNVQIRSSEVTARIHR